MLGGWLWWGCLPGVEARGEQRLCQGAPPGLHGWGGERQGLIELARFAVGQGERRCLCVKDEEDDTVDASLAFVVPTPWPLQRHSGLGAALLLQWMDMRPTRRLVVYGAAVGALHRRSRGLSESHGFHCDTFCGRWRLRNPWRNSWFELFWLERLRPLLRAVCRWGVASSSSRGTPFVGPSVRALNAWSLEAAREALTPLLEGADLRPCLLHGDLWRGNFLERSEDGVPVLLDPAAFWGHNEFDIAQVQLLERPEASAEFFQGYFEEMPRDLGYERRADLYALCPALRLQALFPAGNDEAYAVRCEHLASLVLGHVAGCVRK